MKNIAYTLLLPLFSLLLISCGSSDYKGEPVGKIVDVDSLVSSKQSKVLAEMYLDHGNLINTKEFPPVVRANVVKENLSNWLLVDIRSASAYESGHINGAYNVKKDEIIDFLTEIQKASAYDKVVVICYSGQLASYVTGVLRYAGFDNTYAMLHGMAAWNVKFAGILKNNFGLKYRDMIVQTKANQELEVQDHAEAVAAKVNLDALPKLKEVSSSSILGRARQLLKKTRKDFLIKADEFFPDLKNKPNKYYTINYWNQKEYDASHIKGAHLYTKRKDLSLEGKLTELPKDKPIVIYCKSGHTGGHATAYLQMLGYDAYNLMFGNNGFKYSLFSDGITKLTNDFPVIEGVRRTNNIVPTSVVKKTTSKTAKPIIKRKKKEVSGGCG